METCSFCGRTIQEVYRMIKSPYDDVFICNFCSAITNEVFTGTINNRSAHGSREYLRQLYTPRKSGSGKPDRAVTFDMTPRQVHQHLDRFIIGQDEAKKILSVAVYNHNKRLHDATGMIKKSNILLAVSSGCGKTLLAETLAEALDVPFAVVDATSLTEAGYVGEDVNVCLQKLILAADGDMELAQKGIVYIDEIDKIARMGENRSTTRDVSGEGVQQALLKLIEGCKVTVSVPGPSFGGISNPHAQTVPFDTSDVLFICGGAFDGLQREQCRKKEIGFKHTDRIADTAEKPWLTPASLIKYGMMPEFVGRFPVLCPLQTLDEDSLVRVLTEPEDAITKEYELLLKKENIQLIYEDDALREIAKEAVSRKTGARGLRSILEDIMLDIMYDLPDRKDVSKCIITKECIKTKQPVLILKRKTKKKAGTV